MPLSDLQCRQPPNATAPAHTPLNQPTARPGEPARHLDTLDLQLLERLQTALPLCPRPYANLGEELGLSEEEVLARLQVLKNSGLIRRIGANFNSRALGWHSTLCAASVPEELLENFSQEVNKLPGVTHNYLRQHKYNVWFTLIGQNQEEVEREIARLSAICGVKILNLPARKIFKLKVKFSPEFTAPCGGRLGLD